jgi:hypothetical protein
MRSLFLTLVCVVILGFNGCAKQPPTPLTYSKLLGGPAQNVEKRVISKAKLLDLSMRGGSFNELRLVQIFRRGTTEAFPEYRVFEVRKSGIYDYIGLQSGDVLLAANDYPIFDPDGFRLFTTRYLAEMKKSSINIVREGVAILIELEITV